MSTKAINSLLLEWNKPFGKGYREAQRKLCAQELQPIKEALEREVVFMNQLAETQEATGFPNSAKIARQCADAISLICGGCASAALHKEGAGGECAYKKQHNIGFPCPHCGVIEPLPLQRTLPDEQFKGAVVEAMGADGERRTIQEVLRLHVDSSESMYETFKRVGDIQGMDVQSGVTAGLKRAIEVADNLAASPAGRAEQKETK